MRGERKDGQLHGKMTYYKVAKDGGSDVFNEVWINNKKISRVHIENPEEAWFGNGDPVF